MNIALTTNEIPGTVIKIMSANKMIVTLDNEPGVEWTFKRKAHLTLLRRNNGTSRPSKEPEEVERQVHGSLRDEDDGQWCNN